MNAAIAFKFQIQMYSYKGIRTYKIVWRARCGVDVAW
jgi:hypothetical protein